MRDEIAKAGQDAQHADESRAGRASPVAHPLQRLVSSMCSRRGRAESIAPGNSRGEGRMRSHDQHVLLLPYIRWLG